MNQPVDVDQLGEYQLLSFAFGCLGLSHDADELIAGVGMDYTKFAAQHILQLSYVDRLLLLQLAVNRLVTIELRRS